MSNRDAESARENAAITQPDGGSDWTFQKGDIVSPDGPMDDIKITQRLIDVDEGTRYYRFEYVVDELRSQPPTAQSEATEIENSYQIKGSGGKARR